MQQNQQQGGFTMQSKNNIGTAMSVDSGNVGQVGNQQNSQQQYAFMMQQQQQVFGALLYYFFGSQFFIMLKLKTPLKTYKLTRVNFFLFYV